MIRYYEHTLAEHSTAGRCDTRQTEMMGKRAERVESKSKAAQKLQRRDDESEKRHRSGSEEHQQNDLTLIE